MSLYSVRMQENKDQNNSEYGHFSRSELLKDKAIHLASEVAHTQAFVYDSGSFLCIPKYLDETYFAELQQIF